MEIKRFYRWPGVPKATIYGTFLLAVSIEEKKKESHMMATKDKWANLAYVKATQLDGEEHLCLCILRLYEHEISDFVICL